MLVGKAWLTNGHGRARVGWGDLTHAIPRCDWRQRKRLPVSLPMEKWWERRPETDGLNRDSFLK